MKRILIVLLVVIAANAKAQFTEFGLQMGEMHYIGDLSAHQLGDAKQAHVAFGAFVRNTFAKGFLSVRAGFNLGTISGDDRDFPTSNSLYYRNLNFESYVQDFHGILDVNLLSINPCEGHFFTPYLSGGISVFHFNPFAQYFGQTVYLQTLGTEGQGIAQFGNKPKYALTQISFPVGGGFKILARDIFVVSLEVMYHFTTTDYLDDVSGNYYDPAIIQQYNGKTAAYMSNRSNYNIKYDANGVGNILRGNPNKKDAFVVSSISVTYLISRRCGRGFKGMGYRKGGATKCSSDF